MAKLIVCDHIVKLEVIRSDYMTNMISKFVGLDVFFARTGSIKNIKFTDQGKIVFDEL